MPFQANVGRPEKAIDMICFKFVFVLLTGPDDLDGPGQLDLVRS